ncbi:tRNA wybutosine-synthesizing protein [Cordyceps fumosorosea ARSEF 2679]|uniref:tRNA(Phe) 7-[(3-amino-3-carboxypropyl)-4-demethylwyosine(37)-N(4)]-methyltransferase n=1 Tax=Cordyceps fumosorosea (strain ARSEF 2679) TaxID=1081104 RepID=A0A167TKF1_CORFA|nr:tRNA wybutosine-synthesizing protein [Cordyceps fumosorosea ARSEF 2679]OAA60691.1 tRNA wybutosine-synthesizing protein [Cordyceps fumosorosea ARSEF 2679]
MAGPPALPPPGPAFEARRSKILAQLAVPDAEYSDASPKGTVDAGIRPLLDNVNAAAGFVTTSSCAGRVSVFVEGRKTAAAAAADGELGTVAGPGGKGGGGTWLYVSHDPHPLVGQGVVVDWVKELGLSGEHGDAAVLDATGGFGVGGDSERRLIHFKFEPMLLLRCALHAGFRESGAVSLSPASGEPTATATPMVAVRSMGLGFESLVGYASGDGQRLLVPPGYLDTLMAVAQERFAENARRIRRFEEAFREAAEPRTSSEGGGVWEDAAARRERMRAEGLRRKAAVQAERGSTEEDVGMDIDLTGSITD